MVGKMEIPFGTFLFMQYKTKSSKDCRDEYLNKLNLNQEEYK